MQCRIFSHILLVLLLCHCSAPVIDGRSLNASGGGNLRAASLAAFDEDVRPALSLCAGCHGKVQAPLFLVENNSAAHDAAINNVDFDNIDKSNFLKRILTDKHNCGDCDATGNKVKTALTKWQAARAAAGGGSQELGVETQQLSFPTRSTKVISYDIGKFIGDEYSGGSIMLAVKVRPEQDNKKYSLVNLSVNTDKKDVYVKSIKPLINGKWNSKDAAYKDIACAVKSTTQRPNGHVIHATGTSIVPDDFAAENKLSFAIAEIRLGEDADPSCWSDDIHKDMFTHTIRPIIAAKCGGAGCHASTSSTGEGGSTGVPPDLTSYTTVKNNTDKIKSVLNNHADRIQNLDEDDKEELLDWLGN